MKTRVEETIAKHSKGYNCAQAVACTYCDLVGLDEETMFKITEALGAGMGNMEGTCGAVSAACVLAGLKNSTANLAAPDSKADSYKPVSYTHLFIDKVQWKSSCLKLQDISIITQ